MTQTNDAGRAPALGRRRGQTGAALTAAAAALLLSACQTMPKTGDPTLDAWGGALGGGSPQTPTQVAQPGCRRLGATSNTTNAVIGASAGAAVGGAIGSRHANTPSVGARNGALLGALFGAVAGSQFNRAIGVSEQPDGAVKLDIPGSVMFRSGSAEIIPEFGATLTSVAATVRDYCGLTATIVGHTDGVGSAEMNQRLSTERARSVVTYLTRQGVQPDRLRADGRGASDPIASNATDAGRAQNRRVEVLVRQTAP